MGSAYSSSHTNLSKECTSFEAGATGTRACLGGSFEIFMGKTKENDRTDVWGVEYKTGQKNNCCGFQLKATHDNNGAETIFFGLIDTAENKTEFSLKITRVGRDRLRGGIAGVNSSRPPVSSTRAKPDCTIETVIVSYGCSFREGLFVLEMKKKINAENAHMVTLAHYYVTKDVGLSVSAKIFRSKGGGSFVVEMEGPIKHPSSDLRKVLVKTSHTCIWSPGACSHCKAAKSSTGAKTGDSNGSLLKADQSHTVGQIVKDGFFSSNVREQHNKGLINSSGYTTGSLNNSIIFIDCNF
ncbi:uncharacterized protein LOC130723260 [Lotus japonicus]|uniref:uncharacterized protein LOC130723260 n=1 Tax=Lotus japonicus TaxID=34305 RepID=UPI00258E0D7D|nr:uncharacterized protein LOC130723260 [Lotus japonicus]